MNDSLVFHCKIDYDYVSTHFYIIFYCFHSWLTLFKKKKSSSSSSSFSLIFLFFCHTWKSPLQPFIIVTETIPIGVTLPHVAAGMRRSLCLHCLLSSFTSHHCLFIFVFFRRRTAHVASYSRCY